MKLINKLKELEKEKYNLVDKHLNEILHCRFTYEELANYLAHVSYYSNQEDIIKHIKKREKEFESECDELDFNFCIAINRIWGYFDIYYIKDRDGRLYITEITVDDC